MKHTVIASLYPDSGKTSIITGLVSRVRNSGYIKPFGDRLHYQDKHLWDYDAELMAAVLKSEIMPETMSIGFDHSKIRFEYNQDELSESLNTLIASLGDKEQVYIEAGKDLSVGMSVHVDAISLCRSCEADLIVVLAGESDQIVDDISFIRDYVDGTGVTLKGIIVNKIHQRDRFLEMRETDIASLGVPILGVIPYSPLLNQPKMETVSELLSARVVAGGSGLNRRVNHVFVGAMSGDSVIRMHTFRSSDKLIITSGDRSDMILAAIETNSAGIIITNNILPPPNVIAKASSAKIPLIQVPGDTYETAKQVEHMVAITRPDEIDKIELLGNLVREYITI